MMQRLLDCGCEGDVQSPPSLILHFLGGPTIRDALKDVGALLTTCRSWARYGDRAWPLLRVLYDGLVPSPLMHMVPPLFNFEEKVDESARVSLLRNLSSIWKLWRGIHQRKVTVADERLKVGAQVILFGTDLEFFIALSLMVNSASMISVVVGPSFRTVDLSEPHFRSRFHLLSHERERFGAEDGGLIAVHPSALCDEQSAISVLQKLPTTNIVIGVDPSLGRILATKQPAEFPCAQQIQEHVVEWGRRNITKNGPYIFFRCSFCDALHPLSFCSPAFTGFDYRAQEIAGQLGMIVGNAMISLEERSLKYLKSVSFVSVRISGVIGIDAVLVPL